MPIEIPAPPNEACDVMLVPSKIALRDVSVRVPLRETNRFPPSEFEIVWSSSVIGGPPVLISDSVAEYVVDGVEVRADGNGVYPMTRLNRATVPSVMYPSEREKMFLISAAVRAEFVRTAC